MSIGVQSEIVYRGGMRFDGKSGRAGSPVAIDFAPEGEAVNGFVGLELLLASLAGCSGQTVVGLLRRMGQEVKGLTVHARGEKREIHPTVLTSIELEFEFRGGKLDAASIEKSMGLSEERFCPVWAMVKASAPIKATYRLIAD